MYSYLVCIFRFSFGTSLAASSILIDSLDLVVSGVRLPPSCTGSVISSFDPIGFGTAIWEHHLGVDFVFMPSPIAMI